MKKQNLTSETVVALVDKAADASDARKAAAGRAGKTTG
jgi:hypothetical protein